MHQINGLGVSIIKKKLALIKSHFNFYHSVLRPNFKSYFFRISIIIKKDSNVMSLCWLITKWKRQNLWVLFFIIFLGHFWKSFMKSKIFNLHCLFANLSCPCYIITFMITSHLILHKFILDEANLFFLKKNTINNLL